MKQLGVLRLQDREVCKEIRDIAANISTRYCFQSDACAFKALKANFEELSLLRVHVRGLEIIDTEEGIIEGSQVVFEEVSTSAVDATRIVWVRVMEALGIEARAWNIAVTATSVNQEIPKFRRGRGVARKTAA